MRGSLRFAVPVALAAVVALGAPLAGATAASASAPPAADEPADGTVVVREADGTVALPLSGTGEPGDVVHVSASWTDGGADLCDVFVAPDGTWTCDDLPPLPDFAGSLIYSTDGGGAFREVAFGVISAPELTSDADDTTRLTVDALAPLVSGRGAPGALVTVEGAGAGCSASVGADGAWQCALPVGVIPASSSVRAGQSWGLAPATVAWGSPIALITAGGTIVGTPGDGGSDGDGSTGVDGSGGEGGAGGSSGQGGSTGHSGQGGPDASGASGVSGPSGGSDGASDDTEDGVPTASSSGTDGAADESGDAAAGDPERDGASGADDAASRIGAGSLAASGSAASAPGAGDGSALADRPVGGATPSSQTPGAGSTARGVTTFSGALGSPADLVAAGPPGWTFTGAAALGIVILVLLPAGLLESTLESNRDRILRVLAPFRARRRLWWPFAASRSTTAALVVLTIATTSLLGAFVAPDASLDGGVLRLAAAFAIASVLVNGLALVAMAIAARLHGTRLTVTANSGSLLVTVVTVLVSRAAALQPGFVVGTAVGASGGEVGPRAAGRIAGAGVAGLVLVGVGAWWLHASLTDAGSSTLGTMGPFVADIATAAVVEALTGAVVALLPLRFFAGAEIWRASRVLWCTLAGVASLAAMAVLAPLPDAWSSVSGDVARWLAAFGVATAVVSAVWLWFRFVPDPSGPSGARLGRHSA